MAFEQIEKTYTEAYGNLITLLSQQTQSKLESCVTVQSGIKGKAAVAADQIGKFMFTDVTSRLQDTELQDIARDRRWYEPVMKRGCVPLDNVDVIKTSLDPKSQIVVAGMAGVNRAKDAAIITGYYGVNKTGEHAETSTTFDANNVIASSYASGDIIKQLNHALSLFAQNDVDVEMEEIYCVVNSVAAEKLRQAGIYINNDYMPNKPLAGKKLPSYAGINFVQYEAVPTYQDSGTVYKLPI
ncbi:MAG: hypothetical protein II449_05320, partial [Prevotella sp.]|nr:hypothetical protein [Prevotella sp.]